jgi:hypothetical protein
VQAGWNGWRQGGIFHLKHHLNSLTYAHHKRIFYLFAAHKRGMHMCDMPAPAGARQCRRESARKGWPCNASR